MRELGKVFGLPKEEIDQLTAGVMSEDAIHKTILRYGRYIENFPYHLSIHPGGMLISEEPITNYATIFMPPKSFPTVQLDMFVAEYIGLHAGYLLSPSIL